MKESKKKYESLNRRVNLFKDEQRQNYNKKLEIGLRKKSEMLKRINLIKEAKSINIIRKIQTKFGVLDKKMSLFHNQQAKRIQSSNNLMTASKKETSHNSKRSSIVQKLQTHYQGPKPKMMISPRTKKSQKVLISPKTKKSCKSVFSKYNMKNPRIKSSSNSLQMFNNISAYNNNNNNSKLKSPNMSRDLFLNTNHDQNQSKSQIHQINISNANKNNITSNANVHEQTFLNFSQIIKNKTSDKISLDDIEREFAQMLHGVQDVMEEFELVEQYINDLKYFNECNSDMLSKLKIKLKRFKISSKKYNNTSSIIIEAEDE